MYDKTEELLRTIRLQDKWIRLAKLYIALLESERTDNGHRIDQQRQKVVRDLRG